MIRTYSVYAATFVSTGYPVNWHTYILGYNCLAKSILTDCETCCLQDSKSYYMSHRSAGYPYCGCYLEYPDGLITSSTLTMYSFCDTKPITENENESF